MENAPFPHIPPKRRMETINIYLTAKEKKELDQLKWKYHVSYSTIGEKCVSALCKYLLKQTEYIYKEKGNKTSIKPRFLLQQINNSMLYTNCIKVFLNKDIDKYVNKEEVSKLYSKIHNDLDNEWEENWNGNYFNRLVPKLFRKNPEYYKKLLKVD